MTSCERIRRTLEGKETDRPPVWVSRHSERGFKETAQEMLQRELAFQNRFDWDMARISPAAALYMEDFGCRFTGNNHLGVPSCVKYAVESLRDWERVGSLNPETGSLGEIAAANRQLREAVGGDKPVLITAFSPLTIAEKMAGRDLLRLTATEEPELLAAALDRIAKTMIDFIRFSGSGGEAGYALYFATQTANRDWLTDDQFAVFERAYDRLVLEAVRGSLDFIILHLHGDHLRIEPFADYPVDIVHWADRRSRPEITIREARRYTDKCLMGGINGRTTLCTGNAKTIEDELRDALEQAGGGKLILSPCCVIPAVGVPDSNLHALKAILS